MNSVLFILFNCIVNSNQKIPNFQASFLEWELTGRLPVTTHHSTPSFGEHRDAGFQKERNDRIEEEEPK